jgi:phage repressor protein C with HTH and peptisase S24 domain
MFRILNMEFKDRVKMRMDALGLRNTDISERAKVSKATVSFWLAGTNGAKGKNLLALADVLVCSPTWLETGKGKPPGLDSNISGDQVPIKEGTVPVVGMAKLGANGYFEAIDYPVGHGDGHVLISSSDPSAYALKVVGDSMEPRIRSGEFVLIEPSKRYVSGDEVLVRFDDGGGEQSMIKVFMHERDGYIRLLSVNDAHQPITIDVDHILKIHPVGAIIKPSRYITG